METILNYIHLASDLAALAAAVASLAEAALRRKKASQTNPDQANRVPAQTAVEGEAR
jgi:hypothetical protein